MVDTRILEFVMSRNVSLNLTDSPHGVSLLSKSVAFGHGITRQDTSDYDEERRPAAKRGEAGRWGAVGEGWAGNLQEKTILPISMHPNFLWAPF